MKWLIVIILTLVVYRWVSKIKRNVNMFLENYEIAIIDKAPSRNKYSEYFDFEFDLFHMSQVALPKLLKKDVTLDIDLDLYDLVILVGSEAAKEYAKITSVTNYAGQLVNDKFVCINNPAIMTKVLNYN